MRLLVLGTFLAAAVVSTWSSGQSTSAIEISGPTIVGFFPPLSESELERNARASEGLAHLRFALSKTSECLSAIQPDIHLHLTAELAFVIADQVVQITLPSEPRNVGAYLLLPGKEPRAVYGAAGPSSLQMLMPNAASEYFDAPECRFEP